MPRTNNDPARARAAVQGGLGIALVDGTPLFREGVSALVHRTPGLRWVGSAECPNGAMELSERFHPNVLLLDSMLDPRHQLGHILISSDPALAILALIAEPQRTSQYLTGALTAGAHGIVLRSVQPRQLVDAIRSVHADRRYIDPALVSTLSSPRGRLAREPQQAQQPLSRREYQVLRLIADGLENQAVADALYVSVETVRTHVKSILRKLAARDRTHAVAVAFRSGVLLPDDRRP